MDRMGQYDDWSFTGIYQEGAEMYRKMVLEHLIGALSLRLSVVAAFRTGSNFVKTVAPNLPGANLVSLSIICVSLASLVADCYNTYPLLKDAAQAV
jgi:hypothetical protein